MEYLKSLDQLLVIDENHIAMGAICGTVSSLEKMHKYLSEETLNDGVPKDIQKQFNVAKNMALYTYYFYALAPEVHLKTYTIIEYALKLKAKSEKRLMLRALMELAVKEKWITDAGFRHLEEPSEDNKWCKSMVDVIPKMRNSQAHGSNLLLGDSLGHISKCADFINQLFPNEKNT